DSVHALSSILMPSMGRRWDDMYGAVLGFAWLLNPKVGYWRHRKRTSQPTRPPLSQSFWAAIAPACGTSISLPGFLPYPFATRHSAVEPSWCHLSPSPTERHAVRLPRG